MSIYTRYCNDFIVNRKCTTKLAQNSLLSKGLLNFNKLPQGIKKCRNINLFKVTLRNYY